FTCLCVLSSSLLILLFPQFSLLFFFHHPAPTDLYTLSLHDALPICLHVMAWHSPYWATKGGPEYDILLLTLAALIVVLGPGALRSEEHTSELQSRFDLVCRLLLEKKKI